MTAGIIGSAGGWDNSEVRGQAGGVAAAAIAGYPLGLKWVRGSGYGISAGDISAIQTASLIGAAAAGALVNKDADERAVFGVVTGGYVAGSIAGARFLARPYNLTESQALQLSLGAVAGALIGSGAVWIDGVRLQEPPTVQVPTYEDHRELVAIQYYILGDNRNNSLDSHLWGPIKRSQIKGQVVGTLP